MMFHRRPGIFVLTMVLAPLVASPLAAQNEGGWKSSASDRYGSINAAPDPAAASARGSNEVTPIHDNGGALAPVNPGPTRAAVSKGSGTLPNDQGQVWREYDIRPYSLRVTTTARPEQAIVDWILRETGYEAWHSEPVGLLSANREVLRVYHTAEMQSIVADIVDRFVNSSASAYAFTLRVATVRNPNWRAKALTMMTPIPVQSPGVQGWLMAKENARLLLSELSRRTDYREYNSSQQLVNNGQSIVISTMRPRSYIRGALITQTVWPGYQPEMGTIEEGFSLEFSPLLAMDLTSADAVVKLRLNQIEKMLPVKLDIPTPVAPNQRIQIDVPQMTMSNLHERFRWPTDRVLLLSMGVVATPGPSKDNPITDAMTDAMPMLKSPPRADALLFVESAGVVAPSPEPPTARAASLPQQSFQGRY
ncbi:MAG TPA: hypothetical protein VHK01_17305 [Lacipirellulaceae bacterium]|nr:hypothetical protein [Lacipirellulaceae bacterium]